MALKYSRKWSFLPFRPLLLTFRFLLLTLRPLLLTLRPLLKWDLALWFPYQPEMFPLPEGLLEQNFAILAANPGAGG